ncbi:MAG: GntR family transcriptional regulator [Chitinivibrionales bacterium]|nr:GntR family transcriptional regulator [Chitinivibrionales bacterium]
MLSYSRSDNCAKTKEHCHMAGSKSGGAGRSEPTRRFVAWLEKHVPHLQPGNRLPGAAELAREWGLSVGTVRSVLREFRDKGRLVLVPGKGTFVPLEESDPDIRVAEKQTSTQTVVHFVVSSIRRGLLKNGEALPSIKYMSLQFQVASMTVVRAYGELRKRGLVTRIGKTFWVGDYDALAKPRTHRRACFFYRSLDYTRVFKSGWTAPAYHRFERELLSHNYSFTYHNMDALPELAREWEGRQCYPDALVLCKLRRHHVELVARPLRRLLKLASGLQVLVDWREGDYRMLPRERNVHVLSRGNVFTTRAKTVAEFAVRHNIDTVYFYFDENRSGFGYFLPFVRIRSELQALDEGCRFVVLVRPHISDPSSEGFFERLHEARSPDQIGMVLSKYRPVPAVDLEREIVFVKGIPDALKQQGVRPLFLFLHDSQAVEAQSLIRGRSSELANGISLMSSENEPQYYHEGITCCVPDWDQMGYLMAHSIIGDFPVARTRKGFIRVKADVLERGSTV